MWLVPLMGMKRGEMKGTALNIICHLICSIRYGAISKRFNGIDIKTKLVGNQESGLEVRLTK